MQADINRYYDDFITTRKKIIRKHVKATNVLILPTNG